MSTAVPVARAAPEGAAVEAIPGAADGNNLADVAPAEAAAPAPQERRIVFEPYNKGTAGKEHEAEKGVRERIFLSNRFKSCYRK